MEEIKKRFQTGYTLSIYGTYELLYDRMLKDIETLLTEHQALQLLQTDVKQSVLYSIVDNGTVLEKFKIKENAKNALKDYKRNGFPYATIS